MPVCDSALGGSTRGRATVSFSVPPTTAPRPRPFVLPSSAPRTGKNPLEDIQAQANASLREAMTNERTKRWPKVVHNYRTLLRLINRDNLPKDYDAPNWYRMLLYECHYHLGLALQQLGEHRRAVQQYTNAITAVFIPKNGCLAGCSSNSCLMTPLYARRAFADAKAGDLKAAMRDAEKAVVLDSRNSDVYCIRALTRNTRDESVLASRDVDTALGLNSSNLCALIVKGKMSAPAKADIWGGTLKTEVTNPDHIKACHINPDCHNFLSVEDFKHPDILTFYERFLYSLSVPHTVSELRFVSAAPAAGRLTGPHTRTPGPGSAKSSDSGVSVCKSTASSSKSSGSDVVLYSSARGFRCGTPMVYSNAQAAPRRRQQYAQGIKDHSRRPKTAQEYIASLQKQTSNGLMRDKSNSKYRPVTAPVQSKTIQVFQEYNTKDIPRMYYRPWLGDKLPVAEVERKTWITPPFK